MNKNRVAQLTDQLEGLSPSDDMYDIILEEIKMLRGQGMYSKPKKFKKGREVGVTDPKVVPPNDPSLKPKTKKKSKPKSGAVDKSLRPKARPDDAVRVGPGGVRPKARPNKESSRSPRQFEPMKPTLENKRGFTPGEQTPPMTRGGEFRPPEILGRDMNPRIGVVGMKKGRKVRGAGIASKGVRECKMR
tara:strand:- start:52 stop:618 length:567 start_codon:yes stop_codon:yes gene_type:complete